MNCIAIEEHFSTPDYIRVTGAYGGPNPSDADRNVQEKLLDVGESRLADMDKSGIDLQVLSAAPQGFDHLDATTSSILASDTNDYLSSVISAHPNRFGGFALLSMKDPESAAKELDRAVSKLSLQGAMISGTIGGRFLDDPRFTPVLDLAQRLGVPIYLHPSQPPESVFNAYYSGLTEALAHQLSINGWGWHAETGLHLLRMICSGVFDRFPQLQVIVGHMGEGVPNALARSSRVLAPTVKLNQPMSEYFKSNIWITTSGYFTLPPLQCAVDVIGAGRIMFSVDYPFSSNALGRELLDQAPSILDEAQMSSFTRGKAESLLKLATT
jgi:uncharacterized protein